MRLANIDAMIEAQRDYERKRCIVHYAEDLGSEPLYHAVTTDLLNAIATATKSTITRRESSGTAYFEAEYNGCVFYAAVEGGA